jgi:hypothetical protein
MSLSLRRATAALLLALSLAFAACSDAVSPRPFGRLDVVGEYMARTVAGSAPTLGTLVLSTTENGVTTDHVARGAEVRLVLRLDGTTSGWLRIPALPSAPGQEAGALDEDLTGTWTLRDSTVTLVHEADTFLRDMPLTVRGERLEGDRAFGAVRVRLVLARR